MYWPSIISKQASDTIDEETVRSFEWSDGIVDIDLSANTLITFPATKAFGIPHTFQRVGRWCLISSESCISSCIREKLCINSSDTAAGSAFSMSPPKASQVKRHKEGRMPFPFWSRGVPHRHPTSPCNISTCHTGRCAGPR